MITEAEAAELKKLKGLTQSETPTLLYYHGDILIDTSGETGSAEDEEGFIQFLLENDEFAEFIKAL